MATTHFRTCNLCEAMCGIAIDVDGDQIGKIRGDEQDPFSQGHICPKAVALKDLQQDPDRLRTPLRRVGNRWQSIGWEDALNEAAAGMKRVQDQHGRNALALYQGNPVVHNHGAIIYGQILSRVLGTRSRYSATSLDQLPHMLAALKMFGHQLMLPIPDIDRTNFLLVIGANPLVSNGSLMTAPGMKRRLAELRARGGKLIVVDPRATETAKVADEHIFIRPGTDVLLLLAMINTAFTNNSVRVGPLADSIRGVDTLQKAVQAYTPERVAERTGIAATRIVSLSERFFEANRAIAYGRMGVCTQEFGGASAWLLNVLNIVSGNLDRPGGIMFTRPAIDLVGLSAKAGLSGHFDKGRTRLRRLSEFGGEYPAATLAEEIETEGAGQIRGLLCIAGNPVLSAPNGRRLERALGTLDFMVSVDMYRNESSRHADLILPPSGPLERSHFDLVFHALAVRNTVKYSPAIFERPKNSRHDHEILGALCRRLVRPERALRPLEKVLLKVLDPDHVVDVALRTAERSGLSLKRLRATPHGIDLGPLEPCLPERLCTSDRMVELAPEIYLEDLPRADALLRSDAPELCLIGRRSLRSNNSWMHNAPSLAKGKRDWVLLMHPQDLRTRNLKDGDTVQVQSRVATLEVEVAATADIMPGVASLPHGWGHTRPDTAQEVAAARPGISANDLNDEQRVDPLSGTAGFSGLPIDVSQRP